MGTNMDGSLVTPILFDNAGDYIVACIYAIHFVVLLIVTIKSYQDLSRKMIFRVFMLFSLALHFTVNIVLCLHWYFPSPPFVHWFYSVLAFLTIIWQMIGLTNILGIFGRLNNSRWMTVFVVLIRAAALHIFGCIFAVLFLKLQYLGLVNSICQAAEWYCVDPAIGVILGVFTEISTLGYICAFAYSQTRVNQNRIEKLTDQTNQAQRNIKQSLWILTACLGFMVVYDLTGYTVFFFERYSKSTSVQALVNILGFWSPVLFYFTFKQLQTYLRSQTHMLENPDANDKHQPSSLKLSPLSVVEVPDTETVKLNKTTIKHH